MQLLRQLKKLFPIKIVKRRKIQRLKVICKYN